MVKDKGFRKMGELVAALTEADRALAAGALGLEGLESACSNARELYERLVVLRHKAREAALSAAPEAPAPAEPPAKRPDRSEPMAIRLDTRPPEGPRQTSLIEAIEATEQPAPVAPLPPRMEPQRAETKAAPAARSTLAEKFEKASIPDLGKGISLSHKFWFVAELFNGDRITYEKSIDKLNAFTNLQEARAFVDAEVVARLKKPADPEALATFNELVQRRFA
jgi:hypothetical protein